MVIQLNGIIMNNFLKIFLLFLALTFTTSALANSASEKLGTCMVDTLNGKERKSLAKWIFLAMSTHPEINIYSKATAKDIESSDEYVGKLITRILTVACPEELTLANKSDPLAIQKAFETVGRVAMQELMSNQETMKALNNYTQYADQEKIKALLTK